jgi:hypothetical protein
MGPHPSALLQQQALPCSSSHAHTHTLALQLPAHAVAAAGPPLAVVPAGAASAVAADGGVVQELGNLKIKLELVPYDAYSKTYTLEHTGAHRYRVPLL